jgi:proteasome lid subunit RPN8/RPN11
MTTIRSEGAEAAVREGVRPDPDAPPAALPRAVIGEVFAHAVECYPEECCGLALGVSGSAPERVVRCTNVQNRQHSRGESTLDASRAFWIDERELLDATRAAESSGETILLIYHSHVGSAAYFSQQDLRGALSADGSPLWPGAAQLVVSVRDGVVREAALFNWDDEVGAYRGRWVEEGC